MWSVQRVDRIECDWGQWAALLTRTKGDVPESFRVYFDHEPTIGEAFLTGVAETDKYNALLAAQA